MLVVVSFPKPYLDGISSVLVLEHAIKLQLRYGDPLGGCIDCLCVITQVFLGDLPSKC